MQLPNADAAIVSRNKLGNYLLDLAHSIGGGKARFFLSFGFRREDGTCWLMPFASTHSRILSPIRPPMLMA
jgi:hypothetical protein